MKKLVALVFGLVSSQIFAQNFQIGPHLGHLNMERRTTSTKSSGDIEQDSEGVFSSHLNTNVQGVRATYKLGVLKLYSDFDMARFHVEPRVESDLLKVAVGTQYPVAEFNGMELSVFGGVNYAYFRDKLNMKDESFEGEGQIHNDFEFDPFATLNVEVGLGLNYEILPGLVLTADYKFADSLIKGTKKVSLKLNGTDINGVEHSAATTTKSKVRTRSNELLVGALWSL